LRLGGRSRRFLFALGGGAVGLVLSGPVGAVTGVAGGLTVPVLLERRRRTRRQEMVGEEMAGAVSAMGAGLRAGLSLSQAIRFAAEEIEPPLRHILAEIHRREGLGVPLAEALQRWAEEEDTADARLVAGVLQLHHRTGGDLPAVLDQVSRTLRERRAAAREVQSLTAQARLSGAVLGVLPLGFFVFLQATSRDDMSAAYRSRAGITAIVLGLVLQGAAFVWIRRLLRVEA
jgi:tight adherence protein B